MLFLVLNAGSIHCEIRNLCLWRGARESRAAHGGRAFFAPIGSTRPRFSISPRSRRYANGPIWVAPPPVSTRALSATTCAPLPPW